MPLSQSLLALFLIFGVLLALWSYALDADDPLTPDWMEWTWWLLLLATVGTGTGWMLI